MAYNQILLWEQIMQDMEEAAEEVEIGREVLTKRDPFETLSDHKFVQLFRLNKPLCQQLVEMVTPYVQEPQRRSALSVQTKVLATLRFFATGSYQEITGTNHYIGVSQPSVSRCIREVSNALNEPQIFNNWVQFPVQKLQKWKLLEQDPTCAGTEKKSHNFFEKHGFPGIIGCIDCTHVSIVAPPVNHPQFPEHVYVNRKNYHSINVQLICDSNLRIMNVNARFPGSSHDAYIWRNSQVSILIERVYRRDPRNIFFLIGDSGYPNRPWLLTPILDPATRAEERYNAVFCSIRSTIERCNGVLKNRFRCLLKHRTLHYLPTTAGKMINACVVLHNMCIANNIWEPDLNELEHPDYGMYAVENVERDALIRGVNPDLAAARELQQNIINNHFLHRDL